MRREMGGQVGTAPSCCSIDFEHRHLSKLGKEVANTPLPQKVKNNN
jgi:hypothetical protein